MRYTIGQAALLGSLFAGLSFFALSSGAAAAPAPEVRAVCANVMGLEPGEVHFDGCVQSLSQSYTAMRTNASLIRGRDACLAKGLQPDTPALSQCILMYSQPTDDSAPAAADVARTRGAEATVSYFSTPPEARFQRMRYACGALGLDPTTGVFTSCVADLRATLAELDHPKY